MQRWSRCPQLLEQEAHLGCICVTSRRGGVGNCDGGKSREFITGIANLAAVLVQMIAVSGWRLLLVFVSEQVWGS